MAKPIKTVDRPPKAGIGRFEALEARIASLEATMALVQEALADLQHQFARTLPRATRRKPSLRSMTDDQLSAHRAELAKKAREHRWPNKAPAPKKRKKAAK